jgi:hypothetical protein
MRFWTFLILWLTIGFNIRRPLQNIAPILIIARVGSGRSVGDETSSSGVLDSRSFARASFTANRNPNWRVPNGATLAYPLGSRTTGSELLRL